MVIVYHFPGSVKQYITAVPFPGRTFALPNRCLHPECQSSSCLIRWGKYERWACTEGEDHRIRIQRIRCKVCGRTHSLLRHMPEQGPARATVRERIRSFAYGAGELLLDLLTRRLVALDPLAGFPDSVPPKHLQRISDSVQRHRLARARHFWLLAELLYAQVKVRWPWLDFAAAQFFLFLLHWLQRRTVPPRLFWSSLLPTTPIIPF